MAYADVRLPLPSRSSLSVPVRMPRQRARLDHRFDVRCRDRETLDEIISWCRENIAEGEWLLHDSPTVGVLRLLFGERDAVLFRLRWCEELEFIKDD